MVSDNDDKTKHDVDEDDKYDDVYKDGKYDDYEIEINLVDHWQQTYDYLEDKYDNDDKTDQHCTMCSLYSRIPL